MQPGLWIRRATPRPGGDLETDERLLHDVLGRARVARSSGDDPPQLDGEGFVGFRHG